MKKFFKQNLKNQNGQGVMEYVIVASLIGIFCMAAVSTFGTKVKKRIDYMTNSVERISENGEFSR